MVVGFLYGLERVILRRNRLDVVWVRYTHLAWYRMKFPIRFSASRAVLEVDLVFKTHSGHRCGLQGILRKVFAVKFYEASIAVANCFDNILGNVRRFQREYCVTNRGAVARATYMTFHII